MLSVTELTAEIQTSLRETASDDYHIYSDDLIYLGIKEAVETSRKLFRMDDVYELEYDGTRQSTLPAYVETVLNIEKQRADINFTPSVDDGWYMVQGWRQRRTVDSNYLRWQRLYDESDMLVNYQRTIPIPPPVAALERAITVASTANVTVYILGGTRLWNVGDYFRVDDEDFFVDSKSDSAGTLTCVRGKFSTANNKHKAGSVVDPIVVCRAENYYAYIRKYAIAYVQIARLPNTPSSDTAGNVTAVRLLQEQMHTLTREVGQRGKPKIMKLGRRRRRRAT